MVPPERSTGFEANPLESDDPQTWDRLIEAIGPAPQDGDLRLERGVLTTLARHHIKGSAVPTWLVGEVEASCPLTAPVALAWSEHHHRGGSHGGISSRVTRLDLRSRPEDRRDVCSSRRC